MRSRPVAMMMGALAALASAPGAESILARPSPPESLVVGAWDHSRRSRFVRGAGAPNSNGRPRDRYRYVRKGLRP